MPRGWKRSWVKFWVSECIDGSIREDLEADERGVWYDLIIYSAKCRIPGIISSNETQAISRIRLAGILNISEKLLNQTISKCVVSKRISVDKKGLIHIINWEKYQSESDRVRVYQINQINNTKNSDKNEKPLDDNELIKKSDHQVKNLIDYHYQNYSKKFNKPYIVSGSKDGSLFKKLLSKFSEDEIKKLNDKFFESDDEFIQRTGYTVGVFATQVNKLQLDNTSEQLSKSTKKTINVWKDILKGGFDE